jgi:hypothetical protein
VFSSQSWYLVPSTTTIIIIEPFALNPEFQHFILRFDKILLLCGYHSKRGYWVKGGPKTGWRQDAVPDNSIIPSLSIGVGPLWVVVVVVVG